MSDYFRNRADDVAQDLFTIIVRVVGIVIALAVAFRLCGWAIRYALAVLK